MGSGILTIYSKYSKVKLDQPKTWTFAYNRFLYKRRVRRSRVFQHGQWEAGSVDLTQEPASYLFVNAKKAQVSERERYQIVARDLSNRAKKANINWLSGLKWSTFVTLTLDDWKTLYLKGTPKTLQLPGDQNPNSIPNYDKVGITRFKRNLYRVLNYLCGCPDDMHGEAIWALEEQKRGALHAHILSTCDYHCASIVPKIWRLGFCDTGIIENEYEFLDGAKPKKNHVRYLMKYVHKDSQVGYYVRELETDEQDLHWCPPEKLDSPDYYRRIMSRNDWATQPRLDVSVENILKGGLQYASNNKRD